MSFGAHRYDAFLEDWSRHSEVKRELLECEGVGKSTRGPTWAHIEGRSTTMVLGLWICCSKTKICKQNLTSGMGYQYVLRFEVPMVDSQTVAVLNGIQDLEKCLAHKSVIANVPTPFGNVREKVSFRAIFQDNIGTFRIINNLEHGHYVRMC